ncbi:Asp-tRNA(Asn)/Glu-tRNA(Gln) amidotransferase subunit GatC [Patescibacteria group bacterium]|nr:Asp-tRNA(Asn)/Glu-tRNA(Gln) amidotransferase subunit GatC [Patescibacteria group bacterium]MBU2219040.1 Asp-tRNA(Asn)/Glu-tRNA(Gln) amidotransferase subunit GatC [Patescibacteria group bacterium]MBU2263611.1 Asp-tRNA(Asn)/Glu-tRNA(Gln) amidotransferase subunit GatC [Patescibacteria group bacterium]
MVKIDIEKLALLARIKLTPKEKERLQKEFEDILNYISKLKEVDVSEISDEEAGRTTDLKNVMREDENSHKPAEFKGYIKVKHILE